MFVEFFAQVFESVNIQQIMMFPTVDRMTPHKSDISSSRPKSRRRLQGIVCHRSTKGQRQRRMSISPTSQISAWKLLSLQYKKSHRSTKGQRQRRMGEQSISKSFQQPLKYQLGNLLLKYLLTSHFPHLCSCSQQCKIAKHEQHENALRRYVNVPRRQRTSMVKEISNKFGFKWPS